MEEVKKFLRNALNELDKVTQTTTANTNGTTSTTSTTSRVEANMRSAFPYFQSRRQPSLSNPRPKKIPRSSSNPFIAKETWTHDFFLLASPDASRSPSFHELSMLIGAGLGKKKIVFADKHGGFDHIKKVLEQEYPKLISQNGAFEFMRAERGGASRPLFPIPLPVNGYSLPYLRDCTGSGMVYVRPIQSALSTEPINASNTAGIQSVTTSCVNCNLVVPISEIRQHVEACGGGSSTSISTSDDDSNDVSVIDVAEKKTVFNSIEKDTSSASPASPPVLPTVKRKSIEDLKQIFPSHDVDYLNDILERNDSIDEAVASVLDDEILQVPVFSKVDKSSMVQSDPDPLLNFRRQVKPEKQYLTFNRMQVSVIRQLMSLFKDPKFDLRKDPDVCFVGEMGADLGGPKREFFSTAIKSLTKVDQLYNLQLFGGIDDHLVPLYGVDALSQGCFEMVGKLIAYSVLHSCDGFLGMSSAVIEYLCTGSLEKASTKVTIEDLYDVDLKYIIENKIIDKEDLELTDGERDKIEERMVGHGLTDVPLTPLNKDKAIRDLLIAEVLVTRVMAMDAIFRGMNSLGLGKLMRSYPTVIAPLVFPSINEATLDPNVIQLKFEKGTENCDSEKKKQIKAHFFTFIEESANITDEQTGKPMIYSLIKFVKGNCNITDDDYLQLEFNTNDKNILLEADSCFSKVILPISHATYQDFKEACIKSLNFGGVGFGKF